MEYNKYIPWPANDLSWNNIPLSFLTFLSHIPTMTSNAFFVFPFALVINASKSIVLFYNTLSFVIAILKANLFYLGYEYIHQNF